MAQIKTTLAAIKDHGPCTDGWKKLLNSLDKTKADKKPLSLLTILEHNGLDDALWALRAVDGYSKAMRLYAVFCARYVLPIFEKELTAAGDAAWDAAGDAARDAARAATRDAAGDAARAATRDAAWAAARDAAWAAAWDAAWAAAWDAAWDAAGAAARDAAGAAARDAAGAAAWDAAWDAAWAAARKNFEAEFIRLCKLEGDYGKVGVE